MNTELEHQADQQRYALSVDGAVVAIADYTINGNAISFTHTYTKPPFRNRGLAAELVSFAMDDVEQQLDPPGAADVLVRRRLVRRAPRPGGIALPLGRDHLVATEHPGRVYLLLERPEALEGLGRVDRLGAAGIRHEVPVCAGAAHL